MDTVINEVLVKIHSGMDVFDNTGEKIGTVKRVKMGDEDPTTPEAETATDRQPPMKENSLVEDIAEAFLPDNEIPAELKKRLRRYGYVLVDAGLLHSDWVVANDQIASVSSRSVTLSVKGDALVKI